MKKELTVAALLLVLILAACGDGESRSTTSPPSTSSGAMPRDAAEELETSLHTTDLSISATSGSTVVVTVVNRGPNPADDVWLEVTYSYDSSMPLPEGCSSSPQGVHCKIGVILARRTFTRELAINTTAPVELRVVDRAGVDSSPVDNMTRLN